MASRFFNSTPKFQSLEKDYKDLKKLKHERFCDYCKLKGYTKDQYFKLVGYPDCYNNLKGKKT